MVDTFQNVNTTTDSAVRFMADSSLKNFFIFVFPFVTVLLRIYSIYTNRVPQHGKKTKK